MRNNTTIVRPTNKTRQNSTWFKLIGTQKETDEIEEHSKQGNIMKCKYCTSCKIVKYGYYHNIQRWLCKECGRKFADNKASFGMRTQSEKIATVLTMYQEGAGIKEILRHLIEVYHTYPSNSTIYNWIKRITEGAIDADKKNQPKVGNTWIADETTLITGNQKVFLLDIIDCQTGFILASQLAYYHTTDELKTLLNKSVGRAGKLPETLISNQLAELLNGIELCFGGETKQIMARQPQNASEAQLIERLHSVLSIRTKILRRFKNLENSDYIVTGWPVHYNYLRPYELKNNDTPAIRAGITSPLKIKIR